MYRARSAGLTACIATLALCSQAAAQQNRPEVVSDGHTAILDPKLGGSADAAFHIITGSTSINLTVDVLDSGGAFVDTIFTGLVTPGAPPTSVSWDGKDAGGAYADTGAYMLSVELAAGGKTLLGLPVNVVRLGITEIEFEDSVGNDEFQMVYFKKNTSDGQFYATPATHEYFNTKDSQDVSDLDLDDGSPRPAVAKHLDTDHPVMDGTVYETERYNYPLAYIANHSPQAEVTLGAGGTTVTGGPMSSNYPVPGYDIRMRVDLSTGGSATTGVITPGSAATVDFDALPGYVGRTSVDAAWSFEYAPSGTSSWTPMSGSHVTSHRIYMLYDTPKWKAGASGTQYTGPWVEVAEYFHSWQNTLGIDTSTDSGIVEAFIKGFVGQNGGIPTAIEGVLYDAYPLGGDGGATHYFNWTTWNMDLSALLNAHAKGIYVNCTDNMGSSTTMLSMLGISSLRPVRLGSMTLKAIWGIGAPAYTTALWGSGHSFSYHHIVTRTNGVDVLDTCMQLDEDGTPGSTPGIPGWNHDRLWSGAGGYDDLSSYNTVSTNLESLPGLY